MSNMSSKDSDGPSIVRSEQENGTLTQHDESDQQIQSKETTSCNPALASQNSSEHANDHTKVENNNEHEQVQKQQGGGGARHWKGSFRLRM